MPNMLVNSEDHVQQLAMCRQGILFLDGMDKKCVKNQNPYKTRTQTLELSALLIVWVLGSKPPHKRLHTRVSTWIIVPLHHFHFDPFGRQLRATSPNLVVRPSLRASPRCSRLDPPAALARPVARHATQ